jgi:hypothetical protein
MSPKNAYGGRRCASSQSQERSAVENKARVLFLHRDGADKAAARFELKMPFAVGLSHAPVATWEGPKEIIHQSGVPDMQSHIGPCAAVIYVSLAPGSKTKTCSIPT